MKKERNHNKELLLEKLLNGTIRDAELHQLEKWSHDDPFLAEAMEGYFEQKGEDHQAVLKNIHAQIEKRAVPGRKNIYAYGWASAASVILLIAVFWWMWPQNNEDVILEKDAFALHPVAEEKESDSSLEIPKDISADHMEADEELVEMDVQDVESSQLPPKPTANPKAPKGGKGEELVGTANKMENSAIEAEPTADAVEPDYDIVVIHGEKVKQETRVVAATQSLPAIPDSNVYSGSVVDELGNPLIGANIVELGTGNGTITDLDGDFTLNTEAENAEVLVSYTGYSSETLSLKKQMNIPIVLEEGAVLAEVVVTEMDRSAKSRSKKKDEITVLPKKGFEAFEQYIKENIIQPDSIPLVELADRYVELGFTIDKGGEVSNIEVIKSLCKSCDREAIRLIHEGGLWQTIPEGKEIEYTYRVYFGH